MYDLGTKFPRVTFYELLKIGGIRKRQPTPVFFFLENPMDRGAWWATVCGVTKTWTRLSDFTIHYNIIYLIYIWEKAMAPHSSTLAWKIPWTEEPGRLQSMGSLRVRHDWATSLSLSTFMHWRRKWQPTPVFLPGESHGRRSLVGCSPWGCTESDTTEATQQHICVCVCVCVCVCIYIYIGSPCVTTNKEPTCQCRRHKRHGFKPWVRKIPWRRAGQPVPIFLPGESHGQRMYTPQSHKESEMTEVT